MQYGLGRMVTHFPISNSVNAKLGYVISEICCIFAMTIIFRFPQKLGLQSGLRDFFIVLCKDAKIL